MLQKFPPLTTPLTVSSKGPGYYLIQLRGGAKASASSNNNLVHRAFDQIRRRFQDPTEKTTFNISESPGCVELTSIVKQRGYVFCGSEDSSHERLLEGYFMGYSQRGQEPSVKVVDYSAKIVGFSWRKS